MILISEVSRRSNIVKSGVRKSLKYLTLSITSLYLTIYLQIFLMIHKNKHIGTPQ